MVAATQVSQGLVSKLVSGSHQATALTVSLCPYPSFPTENYILVSASYRVS